MDNTAEPLWKSNPREYWRDWYWNRGGREKVQASRKKRSTPTFKHIKFV